MTKELKAKVQQADRLFTKLVMLDDGGCVTCGRSDTLVTGHYKSRGHYNTRWVKINGHKQCTICNGIHEENNKPYEEFMIKTYGNSIVDGLEIRIWKQYRLTHHIDTTIKSLKRQIQKRVKELKERKFGNGIDIPITNVIDYK